MTRQSIHTSNAPTEAEKEAAMLRALDDIRRAQEARRPFSPQEAALQARLDAERATAPLRKTAAR